MAPDHPTSYEAVIADLEAHIGRVEAAYRELPQLRVLIGALKRRRDNPGDVAAPLLLSPTPGGETKISADTFAGMTISDAAKKYLGMVMDTRTSKEIGEALERGGFKHSALDFTTSVTDTLRLREEFTRVNNAWGLTEWAPSIFNNDRPTRKVSLERRIIKAMKSDPESIWLPRRVAIATKGNLNSVQSKLSSMAQLGKLTKAHRGYLLNKPDQKASEEVA